MENFKKSSLVSRQNQTLNTQVTSSSSQQVIKFTTIVVAPKENVVILNQLLWFSRPLVGTTVVINIRNKMLKQTRNNMFREMHLAMSFISDFITFHLNSCILLILNEICHFFLWLCVKFSLTLYIIILALEYFYTALDQFIN